MTPHCQNLFTTQAVDVIQFFKRKLPFSVKIHVLLILNETTREGIYHLNWPYRRMFNQKKKNLQNYIYCWYFGRRPSSKSSENSSGTMVIWYNHCTWTILTWFWIKWDGLYNGYMIWPLYLNCSHLILNKACGRNINNIYNFEDSFFVKHTRIRSIQMIYLFQTSHVPRSSSQQFTREGVLIFFNWLSLAMTND